MNRRRFLESMGLLAAGTLARPARAAQTGRRADVLLRNGRLCTGDGAPFARGDLAWRGDTIVAVGDLQGWSAAREIDAAGRIVAPGFIDVHSHAAEGLARAGLHTAHGLLAQGVTTVVVNPDGGGPLDLTRQQAAFASRGTGVHVALLIGHGAVRGAVVGQERRAPSAAELETMRSHVRAGLAAGAFGLSSGLFYAPGHFAQTAELVALMEVVAEVGGLHTSHIRDEGTYTVGLLAAVDEIIEIAEASATTGIVSHMKALGPDAWGLVRACATRIEAARDRGVAVFADQYPYEASSTSLGAAVLPRWAQEGGRDALAGRLADAATRDRLRPEVRENIRRRGGAASLVLASYQPDPALEGLDLGTVAARRQRTPEDTALDLIAVRDASIVSFNMSMDDIDFLMTRPWMMTCSDGALFMAGEGRPHPRGHGAFTRKLASFARDRQVVSLPLALRSMTRLSANVFGLPRRGRLEEGAAADVVVFDPGHLEDRATYQDPHQLASGMSYVFVNGTAAVDEGRFTDALAGTVLRR
jgi:N-acyl-D-amino-acid deacylase